MQLSSPVQNESSDQNCPPGRVTEQLCQFDHGVRRCLEKMFNSSMSDACWKQATLPVYLRGLGLREANTTAPAASIGSCNFVATSFVDSSEHANLTSFDQNLMVSGERPTREILRSVLSHYEDIDFKASKQCEFQVVLTHHCYGKSRLKVTYKIKARLSSVSARHSGAWLMAIPNQKLGLSCLLGKLQLLFVCGLAFLCSHLLLHPLGVLVVLSSIHMEIMSWVVVMAH